MDNRFVIIVLRPAIGLLLFLVSALCLYACAKPADEAWVAIFDGQSLDGWTPKFKGYVLGENPLNTFRVEDGLLTVSYEGWERFDGEFGHLYFEAPYERYRLRLEYRFIGDQVLGGPQWAFRNSGVMVHSQEPSSIALDQDFPSSVEVQLLGGDGETDRSTGNLCTPGTTVEMNGVRQYEHCLNSSSIAFHGDQWVRLEIEVNGSEVIRHFINEQEVLTYQAPMRGEKPEGDLISGGFIALQAESHPVQFRNVEILVLSR